MQKYLGTRQTL